MRRLMTLDASESCASVVDPHDFIRVVHRKSACTRAAFHGHADEIGDIIFILRILIAQFRQIFPEERPR